MIFFLLLPREKIYDYRDNMNKKKYRTNYEFLFHYNGTTSEKHIIVSNKTNQSVAYAKSARMAKKICNLLNKNELFQWVK